MMELNLLIHMEKSTEDSKEENILKMWLRTYSMKNNLDNIHPDLYYNFTSLTMNSGLMNVPHIDLDNFIGGL